MTCSCRLVLLTAQAGEARQFVVEEDVPPKAGSCFASIEQLLVEGDAVRLGEPVALVGPAAQEARVDERTPAPTMARAAPIPAIARDFTLADLNTDSPFWAPAPIRPPRSTLPFLRGSAASIDALASERR